MFLILRGNWSTQWKSVQMHRDYELYAEGIYHPTENVKFVKHLLAM